MSNFIDIANTTEDYFIHLAADRIPNSPIKAVFVCHRFVFWACFAALIEECARRSTFEIVVLVPDVADPVEGANTPIVATLQRMGVGLENMHTSPFFGRVFFWLESRHKAHYRLSYGHGAHARCREFLF